MPHPHDPPVAVTITITGADSTQAKAAGASFSLTQAGRTTLSCSGVAFGRTILTWGGLLAPFLDADRSLTSCTEVLVSFGDLGGGVRATLVQVVEVPRCREAALWLLGRTRPGQVSPFLVRPRGVCPFSALAVLSVEGGGGRLPSAAPHPHPPLGEPLVVSSAPFGALCPALFHRSVTTGVCASATKDGALFLTDARCLPGSEGGLVATASGDWAGVVAPSLRLAFPRVGTDPAPGLTPVLPAGEVLAAVCHVSPPKPPQSVLPSAWETPPGLVAVVCCRGRWGTGILFRAGTSCRVLTAGHVVDGVSTVRVGAVSAGAWVWEAGDVVSFPHDHTLDVGLVSVPTPATPVVAPRPCSSAQGDAVYAVGFPYFDPRQEPHPVVSKGVVSSIACGEDGGPLILTTTCAIHPGMSGGGLFTPTGGFMGTIISRAHIQGVGDAAHLNYVLPAAVTAPLIAASRKALSVVGKGITTPQFTNLWRLGVVSKL